MKSLSLCSPAKINLYLKVLKKRDDGFHEIKTIFQRINLFDEIVFKSNLSGKIRIYCDHPHVPTGPKNLIYKVVRQLQQTYNVKNGVDIHLTKRIPVAAGLAGGSTNAATTLLGINKLWNLGLKRPKLVEIASQIGSDVPFFLYDSSWALGTGRGEVIQPLKIKAKLWQILVVPRIKMYSWKVYGGLNLQLTKKRDNANILIHNLKSRKVLEMNKLILNDLENEVLRLAPSLKKLQQTLKSFNTQGVMVSGSGPSVFGITETEKEARDIKAVLDRKFSQVFVVQTC